MWCEFHRLATNTAPTTTNPATTAARFKSVICGYQMRSWIATLHGFAPGLRALLYQEGPYTRPLLVPANGYTSDAHSGVSEDEAASHTGTAGTPSDYENAVNADTPQSWWRLDSFADSVGGRALTTTGTAAVGASGSGLVVGSSRAVTLTGGGLLATFPAGSFGGASAWSMECWGRFTAFAATNIINTRDCGIGVNATGTIYIYSNVGANNSATFQLALNTTYHFVLDYDGAGHFTLYINGVQQLTLTATPTANTSFALGVYPDTSGPMTGVLDEAATYTQALGATRALAHYNAGTTGSAGTPATGGWRLLDSLGNLVTNQIIQAPDNTVDVGLAAVRTAWSANTRARAASGGGTSNFQGIFADDINFDLASSASAYPALYPDNASWWTAQQAMFQTIYPDFTAAGLHLVPNMAQWMKSGWSTSINGILPYTDGGHMEFLGVYPGNGYVDFVHQSLDIADYCVNTAGKRFYAGCPGTTAALAQYSLALLMLCAHATDPTRQSFTWGHGDYGGEYWDPSFDLDLGAPVAARTSVGTVEGGSAAYQRQFTNGWVCVNPRYNTDLSLRASNVTFTLTGGRFSGCGLYDVSSVTLAPGQGVVLALPTTVRPDADTTTTGWATAPLFSKTNDQSDATVITATAS